MKVYLVSIYYDKYLDSDNFYTDIIGVAKSKEAAIKLVEKNIENFHKQLGDACPKVLLNKNRYDVDEYEVEE